MYSMPLPSRPNGLRSSVVSISLYRMISVISYLTDYGMVADISVLSILHTNE